MPTLAVMDHIVSHLSQCRKSGVCVRFVLKPWQIKVWLEVGIFGTFTSQYFGNWFVTCWYIVVIWHVRMPQTTSNGFCNPCTIHNHLHYHFSLDLDLPLNPSYQCCLGPQMGCIIFYTLFLINKTLPNVFSWNDKQKNFLMPLHSMTSTGRGKYVII